MTILHSIILGIVEGVSEFLPISSTGHLMLASTLLKIPQTNFVKSFEIAIQLGAILSVCFLYWRSFLVDFAVLKRVVVAFLPTAVLGFLLYKIIKTFLLGSNLVVAWALFIGGVFLVIFELLHKESKDAAADLSKISYKQSFLIGLFQSVAIVPGVSRAAATIIGGLVLGIKRKTIVEFSFLLAVPTMFAATGLDLIKNWQSFESSQIDVLSVGFITSFVVALFSIKALLFLIKNHNFLGFGIYRILAAIAVGIFVL